MGPPLQSSGDDHRRGLFLTAIGAVLFTFDVPLIRLAASDKWTLMFARGLLLFIAMTILWLVFQRGWRKMAAGACPQTAARAAIVICQALHLPQALAK